MSIFSYRDDNSEYQDHMDISKCIPSTKVSSLSLVDSLEEQVTLDSIDLSPKKAIRWASFSSFSFEICLNLIV